MHNEITLNPEKNWSLDEMAKRLLLSGQASVLSVSEACGFSTVNYFSKCFKNLTGCSPTAYRYSK